MRTRSSALSIGLGAVLLVGAPVAWQLGQPAAEVGTVPPPAVAAVEDPAPVAPDPAAQQAAPAPDVSAADDDAAEEPLGPPTRLEIPTLGVDAPLDAVGLEPDGSMELPEDVRRVGWYEPGVVPGASGSSVLAGHVDSRTQGAGALFRLRELDVGDELVVDVDGESQSWRVVARTSHPKAQLPIEELFTWDGPPRLVVITCGGAFDADRGAYEDNVVVHAVPNE